MYKLQIEMQGKDMKGWNYGNLVESIYLNPTILTTAKLCLQIYFVFKYLNYHVIMLQLK